MTGASPVARARSRARGPIVRWHWKTFWRASLLLGILLAALLSASLYVGRLSALPALFVDDLAGAESIHRLLIVAPHPDDEVIAAGGLMQQVLARGGEVRVVVLTNGDGSLTGTMLEFRRPYPRSPHYIQAGLIRQQESLQALATLGLAPGFVDFLGYPDQGLRPLWFDHWDDEDPYRSPFTGFTHGAYPLSLNPSAVYSGHSLLQDLRAILDDFRPDAIVAPHPTDSHPDHWAAGAFTALALALRRTDPAPRLLLYLVHRGDFPVPRGDLPFAPLLPPLRLVNDSFYWQRLTLPDEMVEAKGQATNLYRSQLPLLGGFLRSFVRQNELFCELTPHAVLRLAEDQPVTPVVGDWVVAEGTEVHPILEDSKADSVPQELGSGADFVALYVGVTPTEMRVAVELAGTSSPFIEYRAFVRAADGDEIAKARVIYPVRALSRPRSQAQGRFLLATFPLESLGYPRTVVVSVEAKYVRGGVVDRIGWALVDLGDGTSPPVAAP